MTTATSSAPPRAQRPTPDSSAPAAGLHTKERLLDAAERLFAQRGFDGTSMRALTRAARTSVSAANYHFGSKEALLRAALERRVAPINGARLVNLDALEERAASEGRAPQVEEVLEAFLRPVFVLRPVFEMEATSPADARLAMRQIAARLYADPPELVASLKRELFSKVALRFLTALQAALPGRDRADLERAFEFTIGVMVHVMSGHLDSSPVRPEGAGGEPVDRADEDVLAAMIAYAAAGLRARSDGSGPGDGARGGAR